MPVLLGASTFNDSARAGAGPALEGCKEEEVAAMMTDPTASHLIEVLLQVRCRTWAAVARRPPPITFAVLLTESNRVSMEFILCRIDER